MKQNSETGDAINLANLQILIGYCKSYGPTYNPSNPVQAIAELETMHSTASALISACNASVPAHELAIEQRKYLFSQLSKRCTRIMNALKASGADEGLIENVNYFVRKINGQRASKVDEPKLPDDETEAGKTHSTAQTSYHMRISHFEKLIATLKTITHYNPNEDDLKISSLEIYLADMRASTVNWVNTKAAAANARAARDQFFYNRQTGLVKVSQGVKYYARSRFGPGSLELIKLNELKFRYCRKV